MISYIFCFSSDLKSRGSGVRAPPAVFSGSITWHGTDNERNEPSFTALGTTLSCSAGVVLFDRGLFCGSGSNISCRGLNHRLLGDYCCSAQRLHECVGEQPSTECVSRAEPLQPGANSKRKVKCWGERWRLEDRVLGCWSLTKKLLEHPWKSVLNMHERKKYFKRKV